MPLTVAGLEAEILAAAGGKATQAGLSPLTNGSNPDLKAPIRKALRYAGVLPADPLAVTDGDLGAVPASRAEVYCDAAVLETLYVCRGRFADGFDQENLAEKQSLHQIMTDLDAMIADYRSRVPNLTLGGAGVGQSAVAKCIPRDRPGRLWWDQGRGAY